MPTESKRKDAALFFVVGVAIGVFASLLVFSLGDNTVEAMKSLVQADAALIGFFAVTTIFIMNSIQGLNKQVKESFQREYETHAPYLKTLTEKQLESDKNGKKILKLAEYSGTFTGLMSNALYGLLIGVLLLVVSILTALLGIGSNSLIKNIGVEIAIMSMAMGIVVVFFTISFFSKYQQEYNQFEFECLTSLSSEAPKK